MFGASKWSTPASTSGGRGRTRYWGRGRWHHVGFRRADGGAAACGGESSGRNGAVVPLTIRCIQECYVPGIEDADPAEYWPATSLVRPPPYLLFHYTDRAGLLGILGGGKLWATSCAFLNDTAEFSYATGLLLNLASARRTHSSTWLEQQILMHAETLAGAVALKEQIYITSFSSARDSLSQWRAYGKPGDAYSIGFDGQILAATLRASRAMLAPCIYDPPEQEEAINRILDLTLSGARDSGLSPADAKGGPAAAALWNLIARANVALLQVCSLIKNPAFREEQEWRLVSMGHSVKFRPGRSFLVPYVELELGTAIFTGVVRQVVIGPTPSPKPDEASLRWFLNERASNSPTVFHSEAPYRAW